MARNDNARRPPLGLGVPKDAELAALLRGSGGLHEKHLNVLGNEADPSAGTRGGATFPGYVADGVREDLAALLARARADGHPAAGKLAAVCAQAGIPDPGPQP